MNTWPALTSSDGPVWPVSLDLAMQKLQKKLTVIVYEYPVVEVQRIIDGDTFWLHLEKDVGFYLYTKFLVEIRLDGVDTPEKSKGSVFERQQARVAQVATTMWFAERLKAGPVWIRTYGQDSFGRWLGVVRSGTTWEDPTSVSLGDHLAELSLATIWPARWRDVYDKGAGVTDGS